MISRPAGRGGRTARVTAQASGRSKIQVTVLRFLMTTAALLALAGGLPDQGARQGRPAGRAEAQQQPREGALRPGDLAPDFALEPRGGGPVITLSSFRGKQPVALVFGSYT